MSPTSRLLGLQAGSSDREDLIKGGAKDRRATHAGPLFEYSRLEASFAPSRLNSSPQLAVVVLGDTRFASTSPEIGCVPDWCICNPLC
jgi:hypothetical protein